MVLFVDLVNEKDSVIKLALLPASQFKTDGYLALNDSLPTGFYWLRAYTNNIADHHMEQAGVQAVFVFNPAKPAERSNTQMLIPTTTGSGKLRMDFFPEGGSVVGGAVTTMAFRVTDEKGNPQIVSGFVKDDHDSVVSSFRSGSSGLGKISFFSWAWRKYHAYISGAGNGENVFALPRINPFAAQLAVVDNKGIKKLRVVLEDSIYAKDKKTYIIGLSRDSLCFAGIGSGSYEVIIPEYKFPYGVADFLLFDEHQHLLSERKLFISGNKINVAVKADKTAYPARQNAQLDLSITDEGNRPLIASMFVKVIDSSLADKIQLLKGPPPVGSTMVDQWSLPDRPYTEVELELLMLTQPASFRKIVQALPALAPAGNVDKDIDSSFYIKGTVQNEKAKPLANRTVTLFSGTKNMLALIDTTSSDGGFCFPLISFFDQTKFNLQVTDSRGFPENVRFILDTMLHVPKFITPAVLKTRFSVDGIKEYYAAQRRRSVQDTIIMGKDWLKEVIVHSKARKPEEYNRDKRVSSFSRILSGKALLNGGDNNIGNALFNIPGITLRDGFLILRGGNGFRHPSAADEPLLIVDGVAISPSGSELSTMSAASPLLSFLSTFSFRIVDFIEVLTGSEAAFFGTRGFNGVILIHTKTKQTDIGDPISNGIKTFTTLGYQIPMEFEQPDYSIKENRNSKFPDRRTLLYWNGDVITNDKGKVSLNFYTADPSSKYYITIMGVTADGRVVSKQATVIRR